MASAPKKPKGSPFKTATQPGPAPIKAGTKIKLASAKASAPYKTPKQPTRSNAVGAIKFPRPAEIRSDLAGLKPPKFTSGNGAVISLIFLNFAWSMWRVIANNDTGVRTQLVRTVAGIWVVGLGILILAQFQSQLALMFAVLLTIGNILSNVKGNPKAIRAFGDIFTKGG